MGGLGVVKFPKFPTVFPKNAFEGFFTLSCEKNAQKFFAQKISLLQKNFFNLLVKRTHPELLIHLTFPYKDSYQKTPPRLARSFMVNRKPIKIENKVLYFLIIFLEV